MFQPSAGKVVTTEAVLGFTFRYFLTVLNSARDTCFRLETVAASASRTRLLVSNICSTETTVHSTGSDQLCGNRIFLRQS